MIKTLKNLLKQDKERYTVPRKVQDVIPIRRIWKDGIFQVGGRFSKTYQFTDINYLVASREDKEQMFLAYSELLNSLDSGATTKITINNRRLNRANFEQSILMPMRGDACDVYRREYNQMLLNKATGANSIIQEKYITVSVCKKDIEEARTYFARIGADLIAHFAALGSKCTELDAAEKLRVLHDFYRQGEEAAFHFDPQDMMRKGHDFKDYICPDSLEKSSDYLKLGEKYCRVLFLKDYASYIKDSMVTELTDFNRNMMLSIDVVPIPTDEAVREVENRLLGIETNITNWQRRQNANNNFSAVVPYDMELQRKESKEFLDDLTTRDQRMMLAVITMVIIADDKKQLDSDTETVLAVARKHMCQLAVLKFQQFDGLNTVLPIGTRRINAFRTLIPKGIVGLTAFRRGAFEQVGHKPLHIVVVPQVDKRIVAVAFLHIQKIQHPHLIALLPQQMPRTAQQLAFRVEHGKARVGLTQIRFGVKPRLACAAAADHDRVEIAAVLSSVQSHTDILREDLVVLRCSCPIFSVDGSSRAPLGRTVFLAAAVIAAGR